MLILKGWECLVVTNNLGCNLRYHQVGCDPDTNRSHRQRFVLEKRHRGGGFSFSAKLCKDLHKGFKYDANIPFKWWIEIWIEEVWQTWWSPSFDQGHLWGGHRAFVTTMGGMVLPLVMQQDWLHQWSCCEPKMWAFPFALCATSTSMHNAAVKHLEICHFNLSTLKFPSCSINRRFLVLASGCGAHVVFEELWWWAQGGWAQASAYSEQDSG